jgi:hypothetical protein
MLLAALEFSDFAIIALLIFIFARGGAAASAYLRPADPYRFQRIEHKLDLILTHLGIDYDSTTKATWQELADDPARKIEAIKVYREQQGVGLAEAKEAVEAYIEGRSR